NFIYKLKFKIIQMFLGYDKFKENGGCGYVLKPGYLCGDGVDYDPTAVQTE
ncbi:hypothetical protein L9F63_025881, partial [Diploptera punctata]